MRMARKVLSLSPSPPPILQKLLLLIKSTKHINPSQPLKRVDLKTILQSPTLDLGHETFER